MQDKIGALVDRSYLRRYHANAIFHRIRIEPGISQRDIIERTGFDKSTVSSIVNEFAELGLIERKARTSEARRGRPSEGLAISPQSGLLVGVQVEATEVEFVACRLDGTPLASRVEPFGGALEGLEDFIQSGVGAVIADSGSAAPTLSIGVSLPGLVNDDGTLVHVPVLGWRDVDILGLLSPVSPVPVFVGNDGKAAAMAEHMFGACVDLDNFIYLFSGSGVGGALFLDGAVHKGATGLAGELGHIKIVPQGRFCSCGASGCLSAYVSEPALIEEIARLSGSRPASFQDILDRAAQGDAAVLNVLEHAGDVLGSAVSSLINIFNPPVVLLGGDLALAEAYIAAPLERALQRLAHPAMYSRSTVKFAGDAAGGPRLGGVALALDGVTGLDGSPVLP